MSYLTRGSAERGAGGPQAGMRPYSRSRARDLDPLRVYGVRSPEGPLFLPSTRPAQAWIGCKAIASGGRQRSTNYSTDGMEAAA